MKRKKYNEELGLASGTEMMRASRQRPVTFKDKSKYNRKQKHKNRKDHQPSDFFICLLD
jgi:stalled ribosome alternative rescue factor ArfA